MSTLRLRLHGTLHLHLSLGASRLRQLGVLHQHLGEYVALAPVGYAAPASVVENITPAPAVFCVAPAPVDECIPPGPALCATLAPVVIRCFGAIVGAAPVPVVEDIAPAPAVSYAAPALVGEYISPAPGMYAAPVPVLESIALAPAVDAAFFGECISPAAKVSTQHQHQLITLRLRLQYTRHLDLSLVARHSVMKNRVT